jgi:hypothetical protein
MNKSLFKKLLIALIILYIGLAWKMIAYPLSLAPEELAYVMSKYEETRLLMDNFSFIVLLILFLGHFYSIFLLFKFKKFGRQIFTITYFFIPLTIFIDSYIVLDSFEYYLDVLHGALSVFIISIFYFSKIEKEFK